MSWERKVAACSRPPWRSLMMESWVCREGSSSEGPLATARKSVAWDCAPKVRKLAETLGRLVLAWKNSDSACTRPRSVSPAIEYSANTVAEPGAGGAARRIEYAQCLQSPVASRKTSWTRSCTSPSRPRRRKASPARPRVLLEGLRQIGSRSHHPQGGCSLDEHRSGTQCREGLKTAHRPFFFRYVRAARRSSAPHTPRTYMAMAYENIRLETQGAITTLTIDRPKALNALNSQTLQEIESALQSAGPGDARAHRHRRRGEGLRGGRGHLGDVAPSARRRRVEFAALGHRVLMHARVAARPHDRGGQRLRARRRLRAGPGVRSHLRLGEGEARPARGVPRRHPGLRRHPAPHPAGGEDARQGAHLHRRSRGRGAGQGVRPGAGRAAAPTSSWSTAARWPRRSSRTARSPSPQAKRVIEFGADQDLRTANELERQGFAVLFGSEDQREGMKAFLEKRPAAFTGK